MTTTVTDAPKDTLKAREEALRATYAAVYHACKSGDKDQVKSAIQAADEARAAVVEKIEEQEARTAALKAAL